MALGKFANLSGEVSGPAPVVTVSAKGAWRAAVLDATAGSQTSGQLARPLSVTSSNIVPIRLGQNVTRIMVRGAYNADATAGSHASVQVYGVYGDPSTDSSTEVWTDTGTGNTVTTPRIVRLDQTNGATALQMAIGTDVRDGSWAYTLPMEVAGSPMIDTLGASWVLVLVQTAAAPTGGTPAAFIEVCGF